VTIALCLASLSLTGFPIIWGALKGLGKLQTNVDELVSLAIIATLVLQEWISAAVVAFIMVLGGLIEEFTSERARRHLEALTAATPRHATVVDPDGVTREVAIDDLEVGQTILIGPGDVVPADGVVADGASEIDESALTGESRPVAKGHGESVSSGTVNFDGSLRVELPKTCQPIHRPEPSGGTCWGTHLTSWDATPVVVHNLLGWGMAVDEGTLTIRHGTARAAAAVMVFIAACDTAPPGEEPPTDEPPTDEPVTEEPPTPADPCVDSRVAEEPDEDDGDCNGNGVPDDEDLTSGFSTDCDGSAVPDECEVLTTGCIVMGVNDYMELHIGTLPLVLSAPHGGDLLPQELDDNGSTAGRDSQTQELAIAIDDALYDATGRRAHVVLMHLHRSKVEANAALEDATAGQALAEQAWTEYHGLIDAARRTVEFQHGRGLYIDLHGLASSYTEAELGYLLYGTQFSEPDERLDHPGYAERSSVRQLAHDTDSTLSELLRGDESIGGLLQTRGYAAVPSPDFPFPSDEEGDPRDYFNGGHSTWLHSSRLGGNVSGLQIEHVWAGVRDSEENRMAYAEAIAALLPVFFAVHLDMGFAAGSRVEFAEGAGELWEVGEPWAAAVKRVGDLDVELDVSFVVSGTAVAGVDYEAPAATVHFDAGQSEAEILLSPLDDMEEEGAETIELELLPTEAFNVGEQATLAVHLADDEWTTVGFSQLHADVAEGGELALVEVWRDGCAADLTVAIEASEWAEMDGDLAFAGGLAEVVFGTDERTGTVAIEALADDEVEGMETLVLSLVVGEGYGPAAGSEMILDLLDEDLDEHLLAWFPGAVADGQLLDLTGQGHHGALLPSATDGPRVDEDGTITFDRVDDVVVVEDFPLAPNGSTTVALWFAASDEETDDYSYLLSQEVTWYAPALNLYLSPGGWLRALVTGADEGVDYDSIVVQQGLRDSTWHHLALTVDTTGEMGQTVLYLDGFEAVSAERGTGGLDPACSLFLGGRADNSSSRHFHGQLADIRIYGRVLDATEVGALYAETRIR